MGLISNLNSWIKSKIVGWLEGEYSGAYTSRANALIVRRGYRLGEQKRFLRKSREGYDDNVIGNFLSLALDRGISLLFGKEIAFEWDESVDQGIIDWLNAIWEANNQPILLHKLAMYGGEDGTIFVKLMPDAEKGWRILAQDPIFKDIATDPDDDEKVLSYVTQYKYVEGDREIAKREVISAGNYIEGYETGDDGRQKLVVMDGNPDTAPANWIIQNFISSRETGGKWKLENQQIWPFALPPIIHWQNLPLVGNVWGMPDIPDDVIEVQDKSNFSISNIGRIIRFFAAPFRWSRGFGGSQLSGRREGDADLDVGPDKMPNVNSPTAEIFQLPPVGDIPGSVNFSQMLRQIIFDVTRNTDITSMKDRVGALTNFGLRILFFDALNKLETKRNLYGWGLREINRRLLIFSGQEPYDCKVIWKDPLPVDETAERQNAQTDLAMGIASKQTIAERLGYDWETEQQRMADEQQAGDNMGAALLRAFDKNGGITPEQMMQPVGGPANRGLGNPIQRTKPAISMAGTA